MGPPRLRACRARLSALVALPPCRCSKPAASYLSLLPNAMNLRSQLWLFAHTGLSAFCAHLTKQTDAFGVRNLTCWTGRIQQTGQSCTVQVAACEPAELRKGRPTGAVSFSLALGDTFSAAAHAIGDSPHLAGGLRSSE